MAFHRLGRQEAAREALRMTAATIDHWTHERYDAGADGTWIIHMGANPVWPVAWWDWLECRQYHDEATRLIEGRPVPEDDPRQHVLRARALSGLRRPSAAVVDYNQALRLAPDDPRIQLEASRCMGNSAVARGDWSAAAAAFLRCAGLAPEEPRFRHYQAVVLLEAGDEAGFQSICRQMIDRFAATTSPLVAREVVETCVLRPVAVADGERLLELARISGPNLVSASPALAAALYRMGRHQDAIDAFSAAARLYRPRAWDLAFRAMAHHHLGQEAEARHWLAEAERWIVVADQGQDLDLTRTRPEWGSWTDLIAYPLLVRETRGLLGHANPADTPAFPGRTNADQATSAR
jgi:tetratricopeptide (TPR) repeat protein